MDAILLKSVQLRSRSLVMFYIFLIAKFQQQLINPAITVHPKSCVAVSHTVIYCAELYLLKINDYRIDSLEI